MVDVNDIFERNRAWVKTVTAQNPAFFKNLARQQTPRYLWIGCADSRVPASQITGLAPGELFVHRNIANMVLHTDLNALSVIQYAVDVLRVEHIIVCGHYDCGGVKAAVENRNLGLVSNWLLNIHALYVRYQSYFNQLADDDARIDRLCELNVVEQVGKLGRSTVIRDAWARGQALTLHGWIYELHEGLLRDLEIDATSPETSVATYQGAMPPLTAPADPAS